MKYNLKFLYKPIYLPINLRNKNVRNQKSNPLSIKIIKKQKNSNQKNALRIL